MIEYILAVIIIIQTLVHVFERRNLYNRLMCRDLIEYNRISKNDSISEPRLSAHEIAINKWRNGVKE